jgi:hypothetical protein
MTNLPNGPNHPLLNLPPEPSRPYRYSRLIADWTRATVSVLAWALVLCTAGAATYVALRALYWAVQQVLRAIGA